MNALPQAFLTRMAGELGAEGFEPFLKAYSQPTPVSVRRHPQKQGPAFPDGIRTTAVPWHPQGLYLDPRPSFTLDPAFHAGAYYVQEASSMFLHHALQHSVELSAPLRVLDLCAAPGGKSTLMLSALSAGSLLVANETVRTRVGPLKENLEKWGLSNRAITSADPAEFQALEAFFDVVVIDAPCSGEGMFRKDPQAIAEWSPAHVDFCAARQKRIVSDALASLKPGGILLYSTCTFNRAENDDNVQWISREYQLEPLRLEVPDAWQVGSTGTGYRFLPHYTQGEGFYLAALRKPESSQPRFRFPTVFKSLKPLSRELRPAVQRWLRDGDKFVFFQTPNGAIRALPEALEGDFLRLDAALRNKWFGLEVGSFKGRDFIPAHDLALAVDLHPDTPALDLTREQALLFLKKEVLTLDTGALKGWVLARFAGLGLGWMKIVPGRINNYFPQERRIRMEW